MCMHRWYINHYRENSPISQSAPVLTLLSWGRWPRQKIPPHPWPHYKPSLIALIRPFRPHCFRTLWCYSGVAWMSNLLRISLDMKMILEMAFQPITHRFESWIKFLGPVLAKLHQNAFDECTMTAVRSSDAWHWPGALVAGGKLCSLAWNRGLDLPMLSSFSVDMWSRFGRLDQSVLPLSMFITVQVWVVEIGLFCTLLNYFIRIFLLFCWSWLYLFDFLSHGGGIWYSQ